jgi:GT2 family glycosyltransferase
VIQQVGLPYREYFIWVDDVEYTTRITNRGYMGIYVTDSEVHHKTGSNYTATIADGTPASAWKYFYEVRNKLHFWRVNYTFSKRVIFIPLYSLKFLIETLRRKDNRMRFFWIVLRGIAAGIFFRPRVRKVSGLVCSITGDTE